MKRTLEILAVIVGVGVTFLIVNWMHFQWFRVSVILYACIIDAVIASAIFLGVYWFLRFRRGGLMISEFVLAAATANLLVLVYAIMGPTVIDRSFSLYIVQKLHSRDGHIAQAAMNDVVIKEYMPEFRLIDVRLTEQVTSGTAVIENGCIILTPRGKFLAEMVDWYRKNFLPKKRVLLDQVTDQLTDPFRDAKQIVDVTCPK